MTSADFIALKGYILEKNPYFKKGYANAFKEDVTKQVIAVNKSDFIPLMPNDTLGNYFYLRNDGDIRHAIQDKERLADCKILTFLDSINVHLVAIVKDADAWTLLTNLRSTLLSYKGMDIVPTSSSVIREQVVIGEMRGQNEEDIAATLQRLKKETIIRVTMSVNKSFTASSCIVNVCKTC